MSLTDTATPAPDASDLALRQADHGVDASGARSAESASPAGSVATRRKSCVIVVENLPVPLDRRVWQEARALRDAGWNVAVICPATDKFPERFEILEDIEIYRHSLPLEAKGKLGFVFEYAAAIFHEARLLAKIRAKRRIDVIQVCNPPDVLFMAAAPFRLLGAKLVYDQHDISPELFEAKFGKKGFVWRALRMAEAATVRLSHAIITANRTFADSLIERYGVPAERVTPVYSIPESQRLRRVEHKPALTHEKRLTIGYVGIINDQDGVDLLVRAAGHLAGRFDADAFQVVVVGDGPALADVKALADELGVADRVSFAGYQTGDELLAHLSSFDVGVIPDPPNDCNDKCSMNKVFEYSGLGVPTVSFPLTETMRLLGEAGSYAAGDRPEDLAEAIAPLLEDDALRARKSSEAKALAERAFVWEREAERYVAVFEALTGGSR
ncbi:MAG: glycosyltransferase family 4 protein [Pseudomonadota bacterium]